jgi:hypothetical protein
MSVSFKNAKIIAEFITVAGLKVTAGGQELDATSARAYLFKPSSAPSSASPTASTTSAPVSTAPVFAPTAAPVSPPPTLKPTKAPPPPTKAPSNAAPTSAPTKTPLPVGLLEFEFLEGVDLFAPPKLKLVFDNMVLAGSFQASAITLQNAATNPTESVRLSDDCTVVPGDVTFTDTLVVTLSVVDLIRILAEPTLARTANLTFLSLDAGSINTITGVPIVGTDGMQVRQHPLPAYASSIHSRMLKHTC